MDRHLLKDLIAWQQTPDRIPLIIRGARQVGKSHLISHFGSTYFKECVIVNFEMNPRLKDCFVDLNPDDILNRLSIALGVSFTPQGPAEKKEEVLLFLDEIQDCPQAILALRYFKENKPGFPVIAAGSLLDFLLTSGDIRIPVGRVQYLHLYPLNFEEYVNARGFHALSSLLQEATLKTGIPDIAHHQALSLFKEYLTIGGMPAAVQSFIEYRDIQKVMRLQASLLATYRDDFGKYAKKHQIPYLHKVFEKAPLIGNEVFRYSKIDPDLRSRELSPALDCLIKAGLMKKILRSSASGLPLGYTCDDQHFKLQFLDIGLSVNLSGLAAPLMREEDFFVLNRGALMEQYVGQQLLSLEDPYQESSLYYWSRDKKGSMAEIDFLYAAHSFIIPIEVKAGKTGRLKSLRVFMEEKKSSMGVKLSLEPLAWQDPILCIPAYMISSLPRLITEKNL